TAAAGSRGASGPSAGATVTTSNGSQTVRPPRTTSSCSAVTTTGFCTAPTGTPNSSPTPPSRSPAPTAVPDAPPHDLAVLHHPNEDEEDPNAPSHRYARASRRR